MHIINAVFLTILFKVYIFLFNGTNMFTCDFFFYLGSTNTIFSSKMTHQQCVKYCASNGIVSLNEARNICTTNNLLTSDFWSGVEMVNADDLIYGGSTKHMNHSLLCYEQ